MIWWYHYFWKHPLVLFWCFCVCACVLGKLDIFVLDYFVFWQVGDFFWCLSMFSWILFVDKLGLLGKLDKFWRKEMVWFFGKMDWFTHGDWREGSIFWYDKNGSMWDALHPDPIQPPKKIAQSNRDAFKRCVLDPPSGGKYPSFHNHGSKK